MAEDTNTPDEAAAEKAEQPQGTAPNEPKVESGAKTHSHQSHRVSSSHKGDDKAAKQAEHGVEFDHGDKDESVEASNQERIKSAKDPWGTTPVQMRDEHDKAVDPAIVGIATRPDGSGMVKPTN